MSAKIDMESANRIFAHSFATREIAVPLAAFEAETPAGMVRKANRDGSLAVATVAVSIV